MNRMNFKAAAFLLLTFAASARGQMTHGVVAAVDPLATEAGVGILRAGGNAVDAAVAVGLTLGVVNGENSGIGGGCFMLIHLANGTNICIDGRETAPARATRNMFLRGGKADPSLSQFGALASGVPGELAAFNYAVKHYGRMSLADLLAPGAALAEKGFTINARYAGALQSCAEQMSRFPGSTAVFFADGKPRHNGELFKQPDLAATYRGIAAQGVGYFYRGTVAQAADKWMRANGGLLTARDFAEYTPQIRDAISTTYRGFEILSFPPPSSGGVHLLEMLNILENFDLQKMEAGQRLHVIAEAMKLAFADRAYWLGDPDFARVPRGLIAKSYARTLAEKMNVDHVSAVPGHGNPPGWETDLFKKHTTHFSVADAEGNWVACTATVNTTFGSTVVIPGTGVVLNDEMDDFSAQPGVPNYFGLIGGEANAVAPGKRPLSSMTPTIVCRDGQPQIALGAAGGPKIITAVLQEIINIIDLGMSPAAALAAPRIHQQWSPDELIVESRLPSSEKRALEKRGHKLREIKAAAVSQIVARTKDGRGFVGAADPRASGDAQGF